MKNKLSFLFNLIVICLFIILIPVIGFTQPPPPPNEVPIDGGLGILMAIGAAYGVKKMWNKEN